MNKLKTASLALLFLVIGHPLAADRGSIYGSGLNHVLYFPHFGNGDFIKSELVLILTGAATQPVIYFTDVKGEVIFADSIIQITENLTLLEDGGLTTAEPIASWGEITISTSGAGENVQGSVKVLSALKVEGFIRFTMPQGIAGVASARRMHNFTIPVRIKAGGINTGLAIHNPGTKALRVACTLMRDGQELAAIDLDLDANNQTARFVDELFIESDTSDFLGSVRCNATSRVTAVALELDFLSGSSGIFTALTVVHRLSGADLGFFLKN